MKDKIIKCQGDDCKENGCSSCGGYGYILEENKCPCGQTYLSRPGDYTIYNGKVFTSVDGLKITCYMNKDNTCAKCEKY